MDERTYAVYADALSRHAAPCSGGAGENGGGGGDDDDDDAAQLARPVKDLSEKWRLIPHFLRSARVVRQHVDSYNYFVNTEIRKIVGMNREIVFDPSRKYYMRYLDVRVGQPQHHESEEATDNAVTPHECRVRDLTYSAPIFVDVEYATSDGKFRKDNVPLGRLPVMLRSCKCCLAGKTEEELARTYRECPLDPGGYFIVRGTEKVILIQEQLSKNRIIIEQDNKGNVCASVTSSTQERKSRTNVVLKGHRLYLRHNTLADDIPIVVVLMAMGAESDGEVVKLVSWGQRALEPSIDACASLGIRTQGQALDYIGARVRTYGAGAGGGGGGAGVGVASRRGTSSGGGSGGGGSGNSQPAQQQPPKQQQRSKAEEARDLLAAVVLSHVPCERFDFSRKRLYIALMIRRILVALEHPETLDDKDYYGNKRLELAGQLLALLFEDLFKKLNADIKRHVDLVLSKPSRTSRFDVSKCIRSDVISGGLEHAISTGNWTLKRFRMERQGVTQVLSRLSFVSALGMMTRITSQFEKTRKISGPRALQPSHWGMLCPSDTPEGESCGLVKNLALMTHVTTEEDDAPLRRLAYELGTTLVSSLSQLDESCVARRKRLSRRRRRRRRRRRKGAVRSEGNNVVVDDVDDDDDDDCSGDAALVFLNGLLLGMHERPAKLMNDIRMLRRAGEVDAFVSVYENVSPAFRAVHIASDGGRVCRPLILVDARTGCSRVRPRHLNELALGVRTWNDMLADGLIEYLDANEENDAHIAMHEDDLVEPGAQRQRGRPAAAPSPFTHLEISPETILGVCAGLIPYANHNQSPRNTYQCAMGKQAIGAMAYNQHLRTDTLLHLLSYPQRPLVQTRTVELVDYHRLPGGQNATVAIMSYSGYDIEDALVVNKASVDRGFGRCVVVRKFPTTLKKYPNGAMDTVKSPREFMQAAADGGGRGAVQPEAPEAGAMSQADRRRAMMMSALDDDGIAAPGERLKQGSIYVNKHVPRNTTGDAPMIGAPPGVGAAGANTGGGGDAAALAGGEVFGMAPAAHAPPSASRTATAAAAAAAADESHHSAWHHDSQMRPAPMVYKAPGTQGIVDSVVLTHNSVDTRLIKVMIRQTRRVIEGDKFASRFGQKGVVGTIRNEEDLPWNDAGIRPDIIFNPHGMPSRMTVGKVFELMASKAAASDGRIRDATAFVRDRGLSSEEACAETLARQGFSYSGKDVFYSGTSGEMLHARVFCGPIFYQRLKHMAIEKCFARSRGPRAVLTRQPTEGRSRDGGLRLGEMERDSLLGYGASMLIMERLMYSSDCFRAYACGACGCLGSRDWCQHCRAGHHVVQLQLPYACKLLFQELQSMNIMVKLRLNES